MTPAERAATPEPVIHYDQPSNPDHRSPAKGKVVGDAEFTGELGHWGRLKQAKHFIKKVGGKQRRDLAIIVRWGDFYQICSGQTLAHERTHQFKNLET